MRWPENSMLHMYFSSGAFILEVHFVIHPQIFLPGGKYNGTFAAQRDASKPVLQGRAFQGLKIQGNKTPSSSLLPFKPRSCTPGFSGVLSPAKEQICELGCVGRNSPTRARRELGARCSRASASPPSLPCTAMGAVLGELQLFSNEIPRVVATSLLSPVHKMCWLDKALRNFKIMLLLKRYIREDFRSIQKQDVVAETLARWISG